MKQPYLPPAKLLPSTGFLPYVRTPQQPYLSSAQSPLEAPSTALGQAPSTPTASLKEEARGAELPGKQSSPPEFAADLTGHHGAERSKRRGQEDRRHLREAAATQERMEKLRKTLLADLQTHERKLLGLQRVSGFSQPRLLAFIVFFFYCSNCVV